MIMDWCLSDETTNHNGDCCCERYVVVAMLTNRNMLELAWNRVGTASTSPIPVQLWFISDLFQLDDIVAPVPRLDSQHNHNETIGLTFIVGIRMLVRHLYIETAPRDLWVESIHWGLRSSLIKQTVAEQFKQISIQFTLNRFVRLPPRFIMAQTKH